jgi:hypothetical protein
MAGNVGDIQGGMEVYSIAGETVGIVTDVLLSPSDPDTPNVARPVAVLLPPDAAADQIQEGGDQVQSEGHARLEEGNRRAVIPGTSPSAVIAPAETSTSYFLVEGDTGTAYVPFSAIVSWFPGENLTLDCTKAECLARYRARPT